MKSFPNTHILKQSYLHNLNLTTICPSKNLWSSCIKTTLESNGHGNVWRENHEINLENIHKCLLDQYRQRAHSEIFNDNIKSGTANKSRTYRMYKSELEIENYIKTRTNYNHRKAMSKLRLSDHNLANTDRSQDMSVLPTRHRKKEHFFIKLSPISRTPIIFLK